MVAGVADELFFAVPKAEQGRLARLEDAESNQQMFGELPEDSPLLKLGPAECTTAAYGNRADVLSANIPAGGTVTARAAARMYAALLGDGGRRAADRAGTAAQGKRGGDERVSTRSSASDRVGAGLLDRTIDVERAGDPDRLRGGRRRRKPCAYADRASGIAFALTKNRLTPGLESAERVAGIVTKAVAES